jgi:hypothetical protein
MLTSTTIEAVDDWQPGAANSLSTGSNCEYGRHDPWPAYGECFSSQADRALLQSQSRADLHLHLHCSKHQRRVSLYGRGLSKSLEGPIHTRG